MSIHLNLMSLDHSSSTSTEVLPLTLHFNLNLSNLTQNQFLSGISEMCNIPLKIVHCHNFRKVLKVKVLLMVKHLTLVRGRGLQVERSSRHFNGPRFSCTLRGCWQEPLMCKRESLMCHDLFLFTLSFSCSNIVK